MLYICSPSAGEMVRKDQTHMLSKINWDVMGITASVLCAIHCAVLPLLVVSLPVLGINIIHNAYFEYGMIVLAFLIGSWSLLHGFRRHHGRSIPLLLFTGGLLLLVAKQIWHAYELQLLPFAMALIVGAHVVNYRLSRPGAAPEQVEIPEDGSLVHSGDRAA
ncbi:MAG TPA: MerC domain-containing protein [Puia sp.]|nr:MerC domain-containing protein [Puia sp.]